MPGLIRAQSLSVGISYLCLYWLANRGGWNIARANMVVLLCFLFCFGAVAFNQIGTLPVFPKTYYFRDSETTKPRQRPSLHFATSCENPKLQAVFSFVCSVSPCLITGLPSHQTTAYCPRRRFLSRVSVTAFCSVSSRT